MNAILQKNFKIPVSYIYIRVFFSLFPRRLNQIPIFIRCKPDDRFIASVLMRTVAHSREADFRGDNQRRSSSLDFRIFAEQPDRPSRFNGRSRDPFKSIVSVPSIFAVRDRGRSAYNGRRPRMKPAIAGQQNALSLPAGVQLNDRFMVPADRYTPDLPGSPR